MAEQHANPRPGPTVAEVSRLPQQPGAHRAREWTGQVARQGTPGYTGHAPVSPTPRRRLQQHLEHRGSSEGRDRDRKLGCARGQEEWTMVRRHGKGTPPRDHQPDRRRSGSTGGRVRMEAGKGRGGKGEYGAGEDHGWREERVKGGKGPGGKGKGRDKGEKGQGKGKGQREGKAGGGEGGEEQGWGWPQAPLR